MDSQSRGKTVRLNGIHNRVGWDVSGAYDFAIWVNDTPVVGNYEKHVAAAVDDACGRTGLPRDDHTDCDVAFVIGASGKIKQRFRVTVRDRNQRELGTIEEWRPVDCVMCSVIALRAGQQGQVGDDRAYHRDRACYDQGDYDRALAVEVCKRLPAVLLQELDSFRTRFPARPHA